MSVDEGKRIVGGGLSCYGLVVATERKKNYEHDDQRPLFIIGSPK